MRPSVSVIEKLGTTGVMRAAELCRSTGASDAVIARLLRRGRIEQVTSLNGVVLGYKLPGTEITHRDDALAEIAVRHPKAVLCLYSALRHHGLTDVLNGDNFGAVPAGVNRATTLERVKLIQWADPRMSEVGVETATVAGVEIRITDPARTVADLFRPEHVRGDYGLDEEVRQHAFGQLIQNAGEQGVAAVSDYAARLGWHDQVAEATKAARTTLKWHAAPTR